MKVLDIDGLNYYDGKIKQTYATKTELNAKAPLASPALTGTPTSQTPSTDDNSTKIATTAYVKSNLGNYATLNGATFTGTVNGVTPTAGDDSTKLATTAYVQGELSNFTPSGSFLPLAGGVMTGDISWSNGDVVAKFNSSDKLIFPDGTTMWVENIAGS